MADRPTVLVVDDDDVLRRATVRVLQKAGYETGTAATGQAALDGVRAISPDVVLLDVVLPDIHGVDVCRNIKATPALAVTQVILISGQATDSDVQAQGLEAGADDYVARPIPNRELLARVAAAVRIRTANEALRETEGQLRSVIEASPLPIFVLSLDGIVQSWNPAAEALFGWSAAEVTGTPLPIVAAANQPEFDRLRQRVAAGETLREVRVAGHRRDGTSFTLQLSAAPLRGADGVPWGIMAILQDITERIAAARQTADLNRVLVAVRSIDRALVRATAPELLVQRVCDILTETGVFHQAWMVLERGRRARFVAHAGLSDPSALEACLTEGDLPVCVVEALRSGSVHRCQGRRAGIGCCTDELGPTDVVAVAPLLHAEKGYGALGVASESSFASSGESVGLLEEIATDVAFALRGMETAAAAATASDELAAQIDQERHFQQRLQALVEVTNALVLTGSVDELCRRTVELASRWLGFERMGIWLHDPSDPGHLHGTFGIDEAGALRDERGNVIEATAEVLDWAERGNTTPIRIHQGDLRDDREQSVGVGTWLRALLWNGDAFAGIVSVDNLLSGRPITDRDGDLLTLLVSGLSTLIFRKRAEDALAAREAFYRTIFETTGAATLVVNDDMSVSLANAESERLLGYTRGELEGGMTTRRLMASDYREKVAARHHARRSGGAPPSENYEMVLVDRDGKRRDAQVYVALVPGTEQRVVSLLDITAQKAAIARAERHAAWQRALNEIIAQTTWATEPSALLQVVLSETLHALGTDLGVCWLPEDGLVVGQSEDVLELAGHVVIPPEAGGHLIQVDDWCGPVPSWLASIGSHVRAAGVRASLGILTTSPDDQTEVLGVRRSSGIVVSTTEPRSWTDEECRLLEAVGRQLHAAGERLRLLMRVRRQAQELQLVLDTVPEGVALLGPDGAVVLANPVARRALDTLAQLPQGRAGGGTDAGADARISRLGDLTLDEVLAPPIEGGWHELTDGERVFEALARPLAESGSLQGWVLVLRDVTREQEAERELRQQERLAAVGRLAAGIAHDFNNIMAVIVLYSQMAAQQPDLGSRSREQMRTIYSQAQRATQLIGQILDFSRSSQLDRHGLALLPYVKEMIKLWERTLPENVEIELEAAVGAHRVLADPTRLQQAFMNLATNARDAMPNGGHLRIRLAELEVPEPAAAAPATPWPLAKTGPALDPGRWVCVAFSDTGVGIPDDLQTRVFEPFFTTKSQGQGTGLGLAQVYGIVKQHDGEVVLESAVGKGTTVSIYLPAISESEGDDDASAGLGRPATGRGETVLVVEDNAATRSALIEVLEQLGYGVLAAANGGAALSIIEARGDEIRAVLTDAIMPEMGGAQLLRTLAERGHRQPVVILSGYLAPEEQADLRSTPNFVTWLTKPVDLLRIAEAIQDALRRWAPSDGRA